MARSGYHYSDSRIFGFSHTHLSGTGIPDYGDILLMPTTGEARLNNGADGTPGLLVRVLRTTTESAAPGYYAVTLKDYGIRAELTATLRAGCIATRFRPDGQPHVVLDLAHRDEVIDSSLDVVAQPEVTGLRRSRGWAQDQVCTSRFVLASACCRWRDDVPTCKALFDFGDDGGPLLVKVGISAVSIDGARRNLERRAAGWDFDAVRRAAERRVGARARPNIAWTAARATSASCSTRRSITRCSRRTSTWTWTGSIAAATRQSTGRDGFTYYTVFSLWDTFRALHPLLTLIDRARTARFRPDVPAAVPGRRTAAGVGARGQRDRHDDRLPRGAGDRGRDSRRASTASTSTLALEAMMHSAEEDRVGLAAYRQRRLHRRRGDESRACRGRSSTPTTTGASRRSPRRSDGPPTRRGSSGARSTGATSSIPRRASCARASRASGSRRSTPPKSTTTTPKPTRGSTASSCRTTSTG